MADRRRANVHWSVVDERGNSYREYDSAILATIMDIRDELQKLNRLLHCENFTQIPATLRRIRSNTAKPRKAKK